jgi:hypothetical protein
VAISFICINFFSKNVFKQKSNVKNKSGAYTEGEEKYMKYVCFLWPPRVVALSVSTLLS